MIHYFMKMLVLDKTVHYVFVPLIEQRFGNRETVFNFDELSISTYNEKKQKEYV